MTREEIKRLKLPPPAWYRTPYLPMGAGLSMATGPQIPYWSDEQMLAEHTRAEQLADQLLMIRAQQKDDFSRAERAEAALQRLVRKLDAIEADPRFQGIWPYLKVHGNEYAGPTWSDELAAARAIVEGEGR